MDQTDLSSYLNKTASASHWKKIGIKKRAGILFPLFSLKTKNNFGIGEFPDLKLLIDWCTLTGHSVIQFLPVNDTGRFNFPYSAISAYALNPLYLSPLKMDGTISTQHLQKYIPDINEKRNALNINYNLTYKIKFKLYEEIFLSFEKNGSSILKKNFKDYICENSDWLNEYSLFLALKEINGWKSWEKWHAGYKNRDKRKLTIFHNRHRKRIRFFSYLQWQAHKQFSLMHDYAKAKGVLLIGDIPYLVGRDSSDVWAFRDYFNMEVSAGAPPDMFSKTGQKWGVPTYNWNKLEEDDFRWYKKRLIQAEKYFDLYRIDHALGIYRIYTIDKNHPDGTNGKFNPEQESVWENHGETLLKMMLDSSGMLPIAEDLGSVPDCVRPNLKKLGIPRTVVDRWERNYHSDGSFVDLATVEPISMNTLSTHDTETLRQWWKNNKNEKEELSFAMNLSGEIPELLNSEIHQKIIDRTLSSSSLFSINLPQDIFNSNILENNPDKHRINIPSTVTDDNWSYSFPIMMEDLLNPDIQELAQENARIRESNQRSGRF